ncbi:MAG: hypothetical protein ACFFDW_09065 [Candidatus Thorarchaeota archaeon]
MNNQKDQELKRLYFERLKEAGYLTIPQLVQILPPTIMNIINSSIDTAEKIFVSALKAHMENINKIFDGNPPDGVNKALSTCGIFTINEIAEINPSILAKTLQINIANAGDIVLFAMELSLNKQSTKVKTRDDMIKDLDKEISHYLGQLERLEESKNLKTIVDDTIKKIYDTIKLPAEEFLISIEQKNKILTIFQQFMTVFPSCTGFAIYNKRGEGVIDFANDLQAKETLRFIHESIPSLFWKISLALEEKNEYGWINAQQHLVWIEAIRNRNLKRQLDYIGLFVFESAAKEGVGTATPTIKGIIKEIERIIYGNVLKN